MRGKYDKNGKLSFISNEVIIAGCDISSETNYVRAIDIRGRHQRQTKLGHRSGDASG